MVPMTSRAPFLLTTLLAAFAAHAGVTAQMSEQGRVQTVYCEGNKMRVDGVDERGRIMIFEGDSKTLIMLDPAKRTYGESTEADMRQQGQMLKQQMADAKAQMEKQMASMSPEQRKQMKEAMSKWGAGGETEAKLPEKKYQSTGVKKTIAGQRCEVYRVSGGGAEEEQCFIPWSAGVVKKDDLKAMDSLWDFLAQVSAGMGMSSTRARSGFDDLRAAPGIPAQTAEVEGGERRVRSELKIISRGSIPADKFRVPPAFKKTGRAIEFGESAGHGRPPQDEQPPAEDDADKK